jgi:acyl dehydratase
MIEPVVRTLMPQDLAAYAGATWDHHRLHYDAAFAAAKGLRGPVVDGQMLGAMMASQLMRHFGPTSFVTALSFRFRSMVFAGDTVRCEAEITADDGTIASVTTRVLVGNAVAADGTATVRR